MRKVLLGSLIIGSILAGSGPARGGVYNTSDETPWPLPTDVNRIRSELGDLRGIRLLDERAQNADLPKPRPDSKEMKYKAQTDELERKEAIGALSTLDCVDLAACRIRLGRFDAAVRVLERFLKKMALDDPGRFMVLLNLASAYQGLGFLDRAIGHQREALEVWPALWAGWSKDQNAFYRWCERYQLQLLKERYKESQIKPGGAWEAPDDLFPGVRFAGRGVHYEAGTIDTEMQDKLPIEAPFVVEQLVLWQPYDDRLYWLFGEILNARGEIIGASDILNELVEVRSLSSVRELVNHRKVLLMASQALKTLQQTKYLQTMLFWAATPRGALLSPGLGNAANECAQVAILRAEMGDFDGGGGGKNGGTVVMPRIPDWRPIAVGFAAGTLVTVLIFLQLREWRRRGRHGPSRLEETEPDENEEAVAPGAGPSSTDFAAEKQPKNQEAAPSSG